MIENNYINAVKTAYDRKEMNLLFGCNSLYTTDQSGNYILKQDMRLTGIHPDDEEPVNFEALLSATEQYYCSLDRKNGEKKRFINEFTDSLLQLLNSNSVYDLYFATEIYFILGKRTQKDNFYPLREVYAKIKSFIEIKINERETELKSNRIISGGHNIPLWSSLRLKNNTAKDAVKLSGVKWYD